MIGYFPLLEETELIYSAMARAIAILFPGRGRNYCAQRLLGDINKTFGGVLPNNCRKLQNRIPAFVELTDDKVVDGSIYHILSPFMNSKQCIDLREGLFDGCGHGSRNWPRATNLRYCVLCAREDQREGRPQHWRVLPNHPALNCCDLHSVLLVSTTAQFSTSQVHDPAKWIDLDVPMPERATPQEIAVAADVRWVYNQKSALQPGFKRVGLALREMLLQVPGYAKARNRSVVKPCEKQDIEWHRRIHWKLVIQDMLEKMGTAVNRLDPQILTLDRREIVLIHKDRLPLQRYSLLAQLVGKRIKDVFECALNEISPERVQFGGNLLARKRAKIVKARELLKKIVRENPQLGRKQIRALNQNLIDMLRRDDRNYYEKIMPAPGPLGPTPHMDWKIRDRESYMRGVESTVALGSNGFAGMAQILQYLGLRRTIFWGAKGRLPLTEAFVRSLLSRRAEARKILSK
jgi:hypothetical protein